MNSFNNLKRNFKDLAVQLGLSNIYKATGTKIEISRKYDELLNIQLNRDFGFGYDIEGLTKQRLLYENFEDVVQKVLDETSPFEYPINLLLHTDNGQEKFFFQTQSDFETFIENLANSDTKDKKKSVYGFTYSKSAQRETNHRRIQRSQRGQGNDLQDCNIIDNELVFVPPSGMCLFRVLVYVLGEERTQEILEKLNEYASKKKILRHNFRQCDLIPIANLLNCKINYYRSTAKKWRYPIEENQICVGLYENHYFLIKNVKSPIECYKHVVKNLIWSEKTLQNATTEINEQNIKYFECEDKNIYENLYMFDLETYKNWDLWFQPFACGFSQMQSIVKDFNKRNCVQIKTGKNCIMEMLLNIDAITKKTKLQLDSKSKDQNLPFKTKKFSITTKTDVFLFAHNSACFDSYFFLQLEKCKVKKMVQKGGIMTISISSDDFKNANFIIKDTFKFLQSSLEKLCTSFKVPEHLCKTSMNHDDINEFNYMEKKSSWYDYLINDVLSLSYIWDSFTKKMRSIMPKVDIKMYCSAPQLSYSYMIKSCQKNLKYFTDPVMRNFVQKANRGGRVIARIQEFKTTKINEILKLHGVKSIDDLIVREQKDQNGKIIFDPITRKPKMIKTPLKPETLALIGKDYQIAFDATSLYPSAMALENATYLDPETTQLMTQQQCQDFDEKNYSKFIVECDLFIPRDLQFVPISIKTDENHSQFSTGTYEKVCLNDVDLRECFRFGIKLLRVHQGIYSEPMPNFMRSFVVPLFEERLKVKNTDSVLGDMYKLILNSAYGKLGQKDANTEIKFSSEQIFFERKYDDSVLDYFNMPNGQICYKVKKEISSQQQQSPNHLAGYVLAYSKQIMNNFILQMGADKENLISYMDTDSFYIHSSIYDKYLAHVKDELGGGKNDYGSTKMIIQAHYLACKQKICYVLDTKTMLLEKKVTWKGIDKNKFSDIKQETIKRVTTYEEENKQKKIGQDYVTISQWTRDQQCGVRYGFENINKQLSIEEYLKKMDLNNGIYNYKFLE